MPSHPHDWLVEFFRNRPFLAPELLREALHVNLPNFTEVQIYSADLTDVQPTEYRADLVLRLVAGTEVLGVVVEVQLSPDRRKRFVWPVYVATLRARLECPVCLLVVTVEEAIARWAAQVIEMGGGNRFVPLVLRPSGVPEVTDETQARADPELAVLSAMAHGADTDMEKAVRIAVAALTAARDLDDDRFTIYLDLIGKSHPEVARRAMQAMDPRKYEYQSEFARRYVAQGRAEGEIKGRAALVIRLLVSRFGSLPQQVEARIADASVEQLDQIGDRLLTAQTLDEALG